ncbi:hypothetical protein [Streptomyces sp. NRRL WC-3742]|uniref:hypothetical protein n=1 Tax=Streptomyces sp. NRRL WC-3742 TaxID=1463934 RepID=UPI0004C585BF|nr:hypothetical protein [Streptomyces sp. NRRL WC-3742]
MTGTIVVHAEPTRFALRSGTFRVVIDDALTGQVKLGESVVTARGTGLHIAFAPQPSQPEGNGLWWESDPALAKRYRKDDGA